MRGQVDPQSNSSRAGGKAGPDLRLIINSRPGWPRWHEFPVCSRSPPAQIPHPAVAMVVDRFGTSHVKCEQ